MKDNRLEQRIQHSLNAELSGLNTTSWQRDQFFANATGGKKVKRKLTYSLVLTIVLVLIAATALAVALLSPKEIVEQVAVPIAQNNAQENYTYEELKELITALNENGITLDEGSRLMQAFQTGHGYWEQNTIREICLAAFGEDELHWNIEQRHWYGEMMVAIGAWPKNLFLLPEEGDLKEAEAIELAVKTLKDTYDVDLPTQTNDDWQVSAGLSSNTYYDEEGKEYSLEQWMVSFARKDKPYSWTYSIVFDRHGENIQTKKLEEPKMDERTQQRYNELQDTFAKVQDAISKYGEVMHFWPDEVKVEIYGGLYGLPYAIPEPEEYAAALEDAKRFIAEEYGADALEKLGDYKVGYMFQKLDDELDMETKALQLMWDIMITTDPEFLSDGYSVQFQRFIDHETGEEKILDVIVEHATIAVG